MGANDLLGGGGEPQGKIIQFSIHQCLVYNQEDFQFCHYYLSIEILNLHHPIPNSFLLLGERIQLKKKKIPKTVLLKRQTEGCKLHPTFKKCKTTDRGSSPRSDDIIARPSLRDSWEKHHSLCS